LAIKGVVRGDVVFSEEPTGEDQLSMARRHVVEGERRIAAPRRVVAKLDREGHDNLATDGRVLLQALETSLALARDDLARWSWPEPRSRRT